MSPDLPAATVTLSRLDGTKRTWRVELTPQTPLSPDALRTALVARFVEPETDPGAFDLTIAGTAGQPIFLLQEREQLFGAVTEI
jgi:hypothetical protein